MTAIVHRLFFIPKVQISVKAINKRGGKLSYAPPQRSSRPKPPRSMCGTRTCCWTLRMTWRPSCVWSCAPGRSSLSPSCGGYGADACTLGLGVALMGHVCAQHSLQFSNISQPHVRPPRGKSDLRTGGVHNWKGGRGHSSEACAAVGCAARHFERPCTQPTKCGRRTFAGFQRGSERGTLVRGGGVQPPEAAQLHTPAGLFAKAAVNLQELEDPAQGFAGTTACHHATGDF